MLEIMKDPNPYVLQNLYWQIELCLPCVMPNPTNQQNFKIKFQAKFIN